MVVRPHELFARAYNMQFALGAFNTSNLELTRAIITAAHEKAAPVIVQTSEGAIKYAGLQAISALVKTIAQELAVPVVLHLDHGKSLSMVRDCIEAGYTSVMIDASLETFDKNIAMTREVVEYAHDRGVWVEAELGAILGDEGARGLLGKGTPDAYLTDPRQAVDFVEQTKVDSLAVSVGTIHGAFTGQEYIRFELLEALEQALPELPLVIHGASGIAADHLHQVITHNVCKINIDTELRLAFVRAVAAYTAGQHQKVDIRDMLGPASQAVKQVVAEKIELFGSSGKLTLQ